MSVVKFVLAHSNRNSRGSAIVLVVFIVAVLMIMGTALLSMSYLSRLRAIRGAEETACRVLTDAGMRKAIGTLNEQYEAGTLDDNDLPMSVRETVQGMTGTFSYQITKDANGIYVITSLGESGNFRKIVVAKLEIQAESCFDYGILSYGDIDATGMTISAYNPEDPNAPVGTYPVEIGTLSTDRLVNAVGGKIYGNAFCGVDGDPFITVLGDIPEEITGNKYALMQEPNMVMPEMPDDITDYGTILEIDSTTVTLTPEDSGIYSQIKLTKKANPAIVYIDGGTVTLGSIASMQVGNYCEIIVNEGSTLLLYLDDGLSSGLGASFTYSSATLDPTHIQIYGTGTAGPYPWAIKSKDVFQGVIYAPNASVGVQSSGLVIGAVISNNFYTSSNIEFLYDMSLSTATNIALSTSSYAVDRWSESETCEIPEWAQ